MTSIYITRLRYVTSVAWTHYSLTWAYTLRGHIFPLFGAYTLHCVDTLFPYLGRISIIYTCTNASWPCITISCLTPAQQLAWHIQTYRAESPLPWAIKRLPDVSRWTAWKGSGMWTPTCMCEWVRMYVNELYRYPIQVVRTCNTYTYRGSLSNHHIQPNSFMTGTALLPPTPKPKHTHTYTQT